jgi:hypothetical protein
MHQDMIKPYTIKSIREEPDGGKTVFFYIKKITPKEKGGRSILEMDTAIYVTQQEDVDTVLFNNLKQAGWL